MTFPGHCPQISTLQILSLTLARDIPQYNVNLDRRELEEVL